MTRDDIDRLAISAGVAVVWFSAVAFLAAPLLVLAGFALWRGVEVARIGLVAVGIATTAWAATTVGSAGLAAMPLIGAGLAIAAGAARLRPAHRDRSRAEPAPTVADEPPPPARLRDPADDPVLIAFLDRAATLDPEQLRALHGAWRSVPPEARTVAWASVRIEATRLGRAAALAATMDEIDRWARANSGSAWTWSFGTMTDVDRGNLRRAAVPALADAAAAILLRDALVGHDRDALASPWESIVSATLFDTPDD